MNAVSSIIAGDLRSEIDMLAESDEPRRAFLRARWFEAIEDPTLHTKIVRNLKGRAVLALPLVAKKIGPLTIRQIGGAYWPFRGAPIDPSATIEELASGLADYTVARELGAAWRIGPLASHPARLCHARRMALSGTPGWLAVLPRSRGSAGLGKLAVEQGEAERPLAAPSARKDRSGTHRDIYRPRLDVPRTRRHRRDRGGVLGRSAGKRRRYQIP